MKDRKKLVKDMEDIQGGFDKVSRGIGQARQEIIETRIKMDSGEVGLEKLSEISDKIADILFLSLGARKGTQDVISQTRRLQRKMNR